MAPNEPHAQEDTGHRLRRWLTRPLQRRALLKGAFALSLSSLVHHLFPGVGAAAPGATPVARLQATPALGPLVETITGTYLNFPQNIETSNQLSGDLRAMGLTVELRNFDVPAWIDRVWTKHDFGHLAGTLSGGQIDPDSLLYDELHSDNSGPGGMNAGNYRNAGYDRLVNDQRVQLDQDKRVPIVKQAQTILADSVPLYILYWRNLTLGYNARDWEGVVERYNAGILRWNNHFSYTRLRSKTGKTVFRVINNHDGTSTNPFYATGGAFNRDTMQWVYDTLARVGLRGETVPWAAQSWRWVNPTTIDVRIRAGMKFHDGRPVTAEDVKFTFDYAKQYNPPLWRDINGVVDHAELAGADTVRLVLKRPYAAFEANMLTAAFIVPKAVWERVTNPVQFTNDQPIGSGFFKFGRWRKNEEWLFVANKDHWTPPNVDVLVPVIPAAGTWMGQLETGELDGTGVWIIGEENLARLASKPHLRIVESPATNFEKAYIAMEKKPFDDRVFRQAIYHAINKAKIVDVIYGKRGASVAGSVFFHPTQTPWYNDRVRQYEYNPERGRQILRNAGYGWDAQGKLHYPP